MTSNYIIQKSRDIGIERVSSAILFGKLLMDYKNDGKKLSDVVDMLLMVTDIEQLTTMVRDYKHHIVTDTTM